MLGGGEWEQFDVKLGVRNTSLDLQTPLRVDGNAFGSLGLGHLLDTSACVAEPLRLLAVDPAVSNLNVHAPRVGGLTMEVRQPGRAGRAAQQSFLPLVQT